jgi:hypothetical protein
MGKAARSAPSSENARRKIAARRQAERRRKRVLLAVGGVTLVVVLVAVLVGVKLTARSAAPQAAVTDSTVATQLTGVPATTFGSVGAGSATGLKTISGLPELASGGKPEVLYMGGEFCPFCAAERWALAAALSRFGTLHGLTFIHSAPDDGDVPTLSFRNARYTSKYLTFTPVEWFGEAADAGTPFGHVYLQQPTTAQIALFQRYAGGAIPFVDIGNRYIVPQAQYPYTDLQGLTWAQIATAMHNPSSQVAKDIDGAANVLTSALCTLTHGQPASVCKAR